MPASRLALPLLLALLAGSAPVAVAAEGAATPSLTLGESTSYVAETNVMTSVKDLQEFAESSFASQWDVKRAAKVENFVMEKDAAKITMTGWIFLRDPVRGIRNRAIFFGDGRFELDPPIELEREQVRRFLQADRVDIKVKQVFFQFTGVDEQQLLESLTYTEEAATAASAENEECKKWLEGVARFKEKGESPEEAARRRFREFELAARTYERVLDPRKEGWFTANSVVRVPEGTNTNLPHLVSLDFSFDPGARIEVELSGGWKHERGTPSSTICHFHREGQYEGDLQWAGTSPIIEAEDSTFFELAVPRHVMKLELNPGAKVDTKLVSEIDVEVLKDDFKALGMQINVFSKIKRVTVDGKEVEFYQPEIPDNPDLRSPFVICALPRKYAKGEKMKIGVEVDAKIFERFDDATWQVNAELNWFPDPSPDLGDTPTVFDTTIRAPKGWMALANGRLGECAPEDVVPGQECYRYVTNIGIDFATINIANNMRADKGVSLPVDANRDGTPDPQVPIAIWTNSTAKRSFPVVDNSGEYPQLVGYRDYNLSENGPDALGRAQIAHKVYSEWFGPCPYDALTITPHPKGHGRGSASLLCISQEAFLSSTAFAELASLNKTTFRPWNMTWFLSHEIGHQWWGGAARIRDGALNQWFSEGFAQYASWIVLEEYDKGANTNWFREALLRDREYLVKDDGHAHDIASLSYGNHRWGSAENRRGFQWNRQDYMYGKGAMVMHSLRMLARARVRPEPPEKGDELFKQAFRTFIQECAGKRAPSNIDLMRSLERTYKMPLDWFFKQWVFGLGIPKVDYSYRITKGADGGSVIELKARQRQAGNAFQFPLAVSLWQGKQELGFDYQWMAKKDWETRIELPAGVNPDKVTLNEDMGVLGIFKEVPWAATSAAGQ